MEIPRGQFPGMMWMVSIMFLSYNTFVLVAIMLFRRKKKRVVWNDSDRPNSDLSSYLCTLDVGLESCSIYSTGMWLCEFDSYSSLAVFFEPETVATLVHVV